MVSQSPQRAASHDPATNPIGQFDNAVLAELRHRLLDWYDGARRDLPWRVRPGAAADPYRVWISEIMLQQTTVATVRSYYHAFMRRWPRIEDLAAADLDDVLHAWQGLGYYARARNLHACARHVAGALGGRFPETDAELLQLPGVGEYTAAAIAAICFGEAAIPVDGNVLRVIARMHAIETALPAGRGEIATAARQLASPERPGDFAQAIMELGATLCRPRRPDCPACPWRDHCAAAAAGCADRYPRKAAKVTRPDRFGVAFWGRRADGSILLRRRPEAGLLGGMMEVPTTPWRDRAWEMTEALAQTPFDAAWQPLTGFVRHTFTHLQLHLRVVVADFSGDAGDIADGRWCRPEGFGALALPTVMKKVVRHAQNGGGVADGDCASTVKNRRKPGP